MSSTFLFYTAEFNIEHNLRHMDTAQGHIQGGPEKWLWWNSINYY